MRSALLLAAAFALAACGAPTGEPVFAGYAEAEFVYVAPTAGGLLLKLDVRRGDRVVREQPLFTLDSESEAIGSDAARARSERADAQAENLRKGRRPLERQAIEQQLAQARAALAGSTATLARNRQLVEQGFVAELRLDELVAARERDAARVKELEAQQAFAAEAARQDEIAAAAAEARGARADLELARWRQAQKERRAPTDALVHDVLFRPGEWVGAGAPVVVLLPPGGIKLRFFVPQAQLARATVGAEVLVRCDGCPADIVARIRHVSPQAEFTPPVIYSNTSRSKLVFMVEAEPADPSALKPGQPVEVRFNPGA